ncbi:MAG TPA: FAD binding domain-containing protein [Candidatus Eisenbacteria bacterium]
MRSPLSELEVVRPRSLDQALRALSPARGARPVPLAGGTDLFVYLNAGTHPGRRFLDLWGLDELRGIRMGRTHATLGALTTFREIRAHAGMRRQFPALVAAAAEIGAAQIQNRATLGGNIANASPAGDSLPVLLAHDAVVLARSARGERAIACERLFRGYRALELGPDELIVAVRLPYAPRGALAFFRKVGTRRAQSISKVVFSGLIHVGRGGRADHVRLAWGSVAPVPLRSIRAEAAVMDAPPLEAIERAQAALSGDIAPIDDIRSDRAYRLAVAGNLLAQFLRAAAR